MKLEYDREVDALYIRIQEKEVTRTEEIEDGLNLDFDDQDRLIGIEILNATEKYRPQDLFTVSSEALALLEAVG